MSSQEIESKELELYIKSHKDQNQQDYLNNLEDDDLINHIENEKNFNNVFKSIKGKKILVKNDIFTDNQRIICSLYEDKKDSSYLLLRAGLMITKYKFLGRKGKLYKVDGIKTILNLEKIYNPKIDSKNNCVTFKIHNLSRDLTKGSYRFHGDILFVLDDWEKKSRCKPKIKEIQEVFVEEIKEEIKEEKVFVEEPKMIKLEIENQEPIVLKSKYIVEEAIVEEPIVEESEDLKPIVEEVEEIEEEKHSYGELEEIIREKNQLIELQVTKINNLMLDNEKFIDYHQLLVRENNEMEGKYNRLRKANSIISRKYHLLNKKYKEITKKDFS